MHLVESERRVYFIDMHHLQDTIMLRLPPCYVIPNCEKGPNEEKGLPLPLPLPLLIRFCVPDSVLYKMRVIENNSLEMINQLLKVTHTVKITNDEDCVLTTSSHSSLRVFDTDNKELVFDPTCIDLDSGVYKSFVEPIIAIRGFTYDDIHTSTISFDYQVVQMRKFPITIPKLNCKDNLFLT
jgi:hypothetical protein